MALFAQSSEDNSPLRPDELRQVLLRLLNCRSCEEQRQLYEKFIEEEKTLCERRLDAERQNNTIKQKELDTALKEVQMWKSLYETIKKKPTTFGCVMKRIFTLGWHRC